MTTTFRKFADNLVLRIDTYQLKKTHSRDWFYNRMKKVGHCTLYRENELRYAYTRKSGFGAVTVIMTFEEDCIIMEKSYFYGIQKRGG